MMFNKNQLFYGDNLEILRQHVQDETVDLCYIDPPFNSKRNYNQIYNNIGQEDIAQAQAFTDTWTWNDKANEGFDEIISNKSGLETRQSINLILGLEKVLGKGSLLAYLVSMTLRIAEIHRTLKTTGSFYLHCDPTASHYLKLVCDAIFCIKGGDFRNEIIWCYKERELSKKYWNKKHDVIFFYTKSANYFFTPKYALEPYSEVTVRKFNYQDEQGAYMIRGKGSDVTSPVYKADGLKPEDEVAHPNLTYRQYLKGGVLPRDWWEIKIINKAAKERLGYPTQKPEALLERIIKASSNEGDMILDAYCGCGTTVAVAERLNRRWIGIDITYQSISLILKRLEDTFGRDFTKDVVDKETQTVKLPATLELNGVPQDFDSAVALAHKQDDRLRKEFEKWAVLTFSNNRAVINDKKGGDEGIDGTAYMLDTEAQGKRIYKQVIFSVKSSKTLSPTVIRDLNGTLEREQAAIGYLLTLYPMDNLVKESKKYGTYHNKMFGHTYPKIEVISIQEMLDGQRMSLPTTVEVLKSAEDKTMNDADDMFE